MSLLDQVFEENETRAAEHDRLVCERILIELERIYQIPFVGFMDRQNVTMVMSFFKLAGNPAFRKTAYELMEQNHVDKRAFWFRLLSEIYPPDFFSEQAVFPNCLEVKHCMDHYEVATSFGTLKLYRLTDKVTRNEVKFVLRREDLHQKCHGAVEDFASSFPDDYIVTSKLNLLFGGTHYHSYMVCQDGSGVMDFSCNTFFEGTCFDEVFDPIVVAKYKAGELAERFSAFEKENPELVNRFYPVLQLALKEEVKGYGAKV